MLERLDDDQRSLTAAMYANGMIGGDDLKESINAIADLISDAKRMTLARLRGEEVDIDNDLVSDKWWEKKDASDLPGEDHR